MRSHPQSLKADSKTELSQSKRCEQTCWTRQRAYCICVGYCLQ